MNMEQMKEKFDSKISTIIFRSMKTVDFSQHLKLNFPMKKTMYMKSTKVTLKVSKTII